MMRFTLVLLPLLFGSFPLLLAFTPSPRTTGDIRESTSLSLQDGKLLQENPPKLNVAIVGVGPSGLLLAHLLLQRQKNVNVHLFERRSDPRLEKTEQRAYALGLGIRGRTAIREVDEDLWKAVKKCGYESERFQLHLGGLVIPLRSEKDSSNG